MRRRRLALRLGLLSEVEERRAARPRSSPAPTSTSTTRGRHGPADPGQAAPPQALHRSLDLVIVDYLQLIQRRPHRDNRVQEISDITRALKELARELDVPIIAGSQLSRAPEQRQPHIPMLSDLRESGSIEQDADIVLFIYREDMYMRREEWEALHPDRHASPTRRAWRSSSSPSTATAPPASSTCASATTSPGSKTSWSVEEGDRLTAAPVALGRRADFCKLAPLKSIQMKEEQAFGRPPFTS